MKRYYQIWAVQIPSDPMLHIADPSEPVCPNQKQTRGEPRFKQSFKIEIEIRFNSNLIKSISFDL
jgi:hypothetical protein